jgi:hypothetical protein
MCYHGTTAKGMCINKLTDFFLFYNYSFFQDEKGFTFSCLVLRHLILLSEIDLTQDTKIIMQYFRKSLHPENEIVKSRFRVDYHILTCSGFGCKKCRENR